MSLCPHNSDPIRWCRECAVAEKLAHVERMKRFPTVLANVTCGFHCPPGWLPMVEKLCALLERIGGIACVQVKEKFGGLRFYIESEPPPVDMFGPSGVTMLRSLPKTLAGDLIAACEEASFAVCLYCGAPGTLRRGGWWRTLCDGCEKAYANGPRK